jgi:hypothetical protein
VVGMALHMARRRADERWESVLDHWSEQWHPEPTDGGWAGNQCYWADFEGGWAAIESGGPYGVSMEVPRERYSEAGQSEGNLFWGRRWVVWSSWDSISLVLRQERRFFGTRIEARAYASIGGDPGEFDTARATLADVDVELVVEW